MKNRNKKAFTIVELVIVIAVIAILAAVMIPAFAVVIRTVNITADEMELTSLNEQLAIHKPETIDRVYELIDETFGEGKSETFAPRSAEYGYSYWYDKEANKVILATVGEIKDAAKVVDPVDASNSTYDGMNLLSELGDGEEPTAGESETTTASFRGANNPIRLMFVGYFILDRSGMVGNALNAYDNISKDDKKEDLKYAIETALEPLKEGNLSLFASDDLQDIAEAIITKAENVKVYTEETHYIYNKEEDADLVIEGIYLAPDITKIPASYTEDTLKKEEGKEDTSLIINLPSTVGKVEEGAFGFKTNDGEEVKVTLQTNCNGIDEVAGLFEAGSTNATIKDANGHEYKIEGNTLTNTTTGETRNLLYGNKVESFNLQPAVSGSGFLFVPSNNTLYVAHDSGSFKIDPIDFVATKNDEKVVKLVKWSTTGGVSVDNEYNFTVTGEGTIIATSVTDENVTATVTVKVVTMENATFKVGGNQLSAASSQGFELTYDGTAATAEYAISDIKLSYSHGVECKCCEGVTPVFTTEGDRFTISEVNGQYVLKLNTSNRELEGEQTFTIKVGEHIEKTFTVKVIDNSETVFAKVLSNDYLYRVGNSNNITLGQLFKTDDRIKGEISVKIYDAAIGEKKTVDELTGNNLKATYTKSGLTKDNWADSEINFDGTGVAIIKIENEFGTQKVVVEVVDGYNITDASQLKSNANNILLNDIKLVGADARFSLTGNANNHAVLYGNGFVFDITEATSKGNGIINLTNADLDNVQIIGKVYTTYQDTEGQGQNEWYASAVLVRSGSTRISNSYIFGCRSNIRTEGELEIIDSVVECARLSNINIIAGTLTIDGLTTINEPNASNSNVVGLGIMFDTNSADSAKIVIKGELKQYNWVRESDESYLPNMTGMGTLVDKIFAQTKYLHTIDGVKYANMGIAGLNGNIPTSAVTYSDPYEATSLSLLTYNGFVVSPSDAKYEATAADLVYRNTEFDYTPTAQGSTVPTISWADGYESGVIDITFERGETFNFSPDGILSAVKHGNNLAATVTFNGTDYTGKTIAFTTDGKYTITYTIKDPYVYDNSGNTVAEVEHTYYLVVNVITTVPAQKAPEFSFTGATGFTTVEYNGKTYVVPTGNTSDTSKFHHIGNGIYAPIVTVQIKDNTSDFTGYYPIFGGISITWYDEAGNATTYNSSSNLSAMPEGLEWITDITNLKGSKVWNGYKKYSSSGLCREAEADGSTNSSDTYKDVEFSFQVEGVGKYYYYIRFKEPAHTCPSGCVTGDTLVTLADGTQKQIQDVTPEDMLLTWNHFTGEYQAVPAAIIFDHGYANNTVIKLNFSDGTQVKVINLHQFLDADLKEYVTIKADTVADYVGHSFVKQSGEGYTTVTLESYEISEEYIEAYGIISALNYNIFVEGMLSTDFMEQDYDLFNYFTIGEGMVFDAEQMQEDIEKYGLYTYEEFADYLTYEQFVGFNVQYFKISVGKGYYTYNEILGLIDTYLNK